MEKICRSLPRTKRRFYYWEVWHSSQPWLGDEFTAVMNYAFTESIDYLWKEDSVNKLVSNLNEQLTLYRKQTNQMMLNTIDSHDTHV
ncbi:MAG: hypothetical protein ACLTW7_15475 [Enterococcus sp.]|uniref:hypothetical protein n=1 Tax=Enterococcus sp. TaxID=35783 RepID=UPI003995A071